MYATPPILTSISICGHQARHCLRMINVWPISQIEHPSAKQTHSVAPRLYPSNVLPLFASLTMSAICIVATPSKRTKIPVSASEVGTHVGWAKLAVSTLSILAAYIPMLGRMEGQSA